MAWAINIMSLCCVIVGLFVLYSILQGQLLQKEKDFALQKVLGMSGGQIFGTIFVEYILVVFLALFFGNTIGTMISFLVSYLLLDGIFVFNWPFFWVLNTTMFFMTSVVIAVSFKLKYSKRVNQLLQS
jgi:predicted lysophospholipase L1 biosynthesis ABC-type transport system permease subunit